MKMEDRLHRVEAKIDKLQEAVISLARVEEQLVTVFNRQSSIESKVNGLDDKVDRLSESVIKGKSAERIVWLVVAAAIGAAFRFLG
jgi:vacuolar-type H+-ATPase subunit E/Vma4|tara:strand:+ start:209 stop:466 length:258 start_codon:yes stop_codon:yes gene_type:complete